MGMLREIFGGVIDADGLHADVLLDDGSEGANEGRRQAGREGPERLIETARDGLARAQAAALSPLRERLEVVAAIEDEASFRTELEALQADLPELLRQVNQHPAVVKILEQTMSAALLTAMTERTERRAGTARPTRDEGTERRAGTARPTGGRGGG